jgi:hypothetical protein
VMCRDVLWSHKKYPYIYITGREKVRESERKMRTN